MSIGWLFLALVILAVAKLLSRARMYARLFGDDHFIEIGRGLAGVRTAALEHIADEDDAEPPARDDPRALATSSGLVVVYTVRRRQAEFVHHCSVGAARSATAHTVGETFVLFTAKVLRLPTEKMNFYFTKSTVHHGEAVIDEAEHDALVAAGPVVVTMNNVADLRRQAMEARAGIRWK
jgi:hypothetical protein